MSRKVDTPNLDSERNKVTESYMDYGKSELVELLVDEMLPADLLTHAIEDLAILQEDDDPDQGEIAQQKERIELIKIEIDDIQKAERELAQIYKEAADGDTNATSAKQPLP